MKFSYIALLLLALVFLAKSQIGDVIDNIGNEIDETVNDVGDAITGNDDENNNNDDNNGDIGDNISEGVDDIGDSITEGVDDIGEDISNGVDDAIVGIIGGVLPDGAADLWQDINDLLDQIRNLQQNNTNVQTQKIQIYDIFNDANQDDLCNHCTAFVNDLKDLSDESDGENCLKNFSFFSLT